MKRFVPFALLLILPGLVFTQGQNLRMLHDKTEKQLRGIVENSRGIVGISVLDLTSGERFAVNDELVFPQASAIKIPILMEVYKQASEQRFRLTDMRWVRKRDKVGGSGALQELGDSTAQLSIRDLCIVMILLSDNTATNMLIDEVGMDNINRTIASLGLKQTRVQRKMLDVAASGRGDENISTPAEAARLMEILYKGEFIGRAACDDILAILKKPKDGAMKSELPDGTPIAFKPGGIAGVSTEWAIVYLKERPFVAVFMENYELENEAQGSMRAVSRFLVNYFMRLGRATKYGTYVDPSLPK